MKPLLFGDTERPLYGVYHAPIEDALASNVKGVVMFAGFGNEAIVAYSFFRQLAARVQRYGAHVLRFDYLGTGDSWGDDDTFSLQQAITDGYAAATELNELAAPDKLIFIGMRLGANVALELANQIPSVDGLVLINPILDGSSYLQEITHRDVVSPMYDGAKCIPGETTVASDGFALSPALFQELNQLEGIKQIKNSDTDMYLISEQEMHELEIPAQNTNHIIEHAVSNNSDLWVRSPGADMPDHSMESTSSIIDWVKAR